MATDTSAWRANVPEVKEALKRAAEDEARSQASLIEKILQGLASRNGYLPQTKEAKKKGKA